MGLDHGQDSAAIATVRTFVLARSHDGRLFDLDNGAPPPVKGGYDGEGGEHKKDHPKLGQWMATSIAGNDLLSSCLYTAGICAGYAGKMAPASLLLVSAMLYLFRYVYGEVVTAMPVNGGSYTALSNTTSKRMAALAACCSIISYIATAVVSAESAVNYMQLLWPASNNLTGTLTGTIIVLGVFAVLNLMGMTESATVATTLFVTHFFALCILIIWATVYACRDEWSLFKDNMDTPYPDGATWAGALYFGYSAALLGITGFETAANYVEEMKSSTTYIRVLRNMWVSVAVMNPIIGLLALAVLPVEQMYNYSSNLLGPMALAVGGEAFQTFICIDGFLVLSGSVLTAYVGIGGLIRRMAQDRILPSFLLAKNRWRGTHHWIILGFFAVCSSLLLALDGDVDMLGSVYNIAFLSVMSAFACSCLVLKFKRPRLPRKVVASWGVVLLALATVLAGLVGNIIRSPVVLAWFALYYGVVLMVVQFMFNRVPLLQFAIRLVKAALPTVGEVSARERMERALKVAHRDAERRVSRASSVRSSWGRSSTIAGGSGGGGGPVRRGTTVGVPGDLLALHAEDHPSASSSAGGGPSAAGTAHVVGGRLAGHPSAGSEMDIAAGLAVPLRWAARAGGDDEEEEEDGEDQFALGGLTPGGRSQGGGSSGASAGYQELLLDPAMAHKDEEEGEQGEEERALLTGQAPTWRGRLRAYLLTGLHARLHAITGSPIVFFAKTADLSVLNKAVRYVRGNESSTHLVLVHVVDDSSAVEGLTDGLRAMAAARAAEGGGGAQGGPQGGETAASFAQELRVELARSLPPSTVGSQLDASVAILNTAYPKLHTTALVLRGTCFGPGAVRYVSAHLGVPPQSMLMAMPDERFTYPFAALGGVRVITRVR